jgi:hypothetical protein
MNNETKAMIACALVGFAIGAMITIAALNGGAL